MHERKTMKNIIRYAIFLLTASIALAQGNSKIAQDLQQIDPKEKVDVIVQFVQPPGQSDFDAVRGHGGQFKKELPAIHGALFSMPARALRALENNPVIEYVSPDRELNATLDYANPTVGADIAFQYGWDGEGIGIAIIDSGVEKHEDLTRTSDRIVYNEGFDEPGKFGDAYGHGTHVAGMAAGDGDKSPQSATFQGIAPKAHLINLRVLDKDGQGRRSGASPTSFTPKTVLSFTKTKFKTPTVKSWQGDFLNFLFADRFSPVV